MTDQKHSFGKRTPPKTPSAAPVKRSGHVALLLVGTLGVGGAAYAMMSRPNCTPASPGMAGPADGSCAQRSSGGGGSGGSHFYSSSDTSSSGRSSTASSQSGGVSRGGFGSFAHAFGFSGGG